jgi:pyruvate formate-lyase/glycerol dehydratase family glycyl radical enzyme
MAEELLRIERLKKKIFEVPPTLSVERSKIAAACDVDEFKPQVIKSALILRAVLEKISVKILDDELIVGVGGKDMNVAQIFFPDSNPVNIEKEIDTVGTRKQDPFYMDEEERGELNKLIEYWRGRSIVENIDKIIDNESSKLLKAGAFFTQKEMGYGHCLADFELVLKEGFTGIRTKATENKTHTGVSKSQMDFWTGVEIVCDGVVSFAGRYSALAAKMAAGETNETRKAELTEISRICAKVPAYPAESFHEALQAIWMTQLIIQLESNGTGVSFGRLDQYAYPYYKNSVEKGIAQEKLQELLDCLWIKTNHVLKFRGAASAALWSGYIVNQNITIGGQDRCGRDVTNELTWMCLEAEGKLHLKEPQFTLRIHAGTPEKLLVRAAKVIAGGGGKPQLVGDNTIISALQNVGIPLTKARDYGIIGCVEPSVVGGWGSHKSGHLNLPKVLELALFNGFDPVRGEQVSEKTGKVQECRNFEEFFALFSRQLKYVVGKMIHIQRDITHEHLRKYLPHVYLSSIYPDCIKSGHAFADGGARYHWSSFTATGLANLVDSLYSIKKLVYDDRVITMDEMLQALSDNFKGHNLLLAQINNLPKYGNDICKVDDIANLVAERLYDTGALFKGFGNSEVFFGFVTVTKSVAYGVYTGATPDGRKKGTAFADGVSPSHGADLCGPTAIFKSVDKIDLPRASEGAILNQKLIPEALKDEGQCLRFADLIRTYVQDLRGLHVQFNVVSAKTLRAAQQNPEEYKDLLVRVSGFSAYFVELTRDVQEDVIGRTEFQSI